MPESLSDFKQSNTYLYIAVFFSGLTSLAVEMASSRLLGNVFGTSNLVWASIIGLILIYLTLGYFIGGKWADRSPSYKTFYQILIWASLAIGIVPVISKPVLSLAANAFDQLQLGILLSSFLSVLILLIVPVTLLGTTSPFAIRLAVKDFKGGWQHIRAHLRHLHPGIFHWHIRAGAIFDPADRYLPYIYHILCYPAGNGFDRPVPDLRMAGHPALPVDAAAGDCIIHMGCERDRKSHSRPGV